MVSSVKGPGRFERKKMDWEQNERGGCEGYGKWVLKKSVLFWDFGD
jgi:hypothetical protein